MIKIELKDIHFSYQTGDNSYIPVLKNLNASVNSGEIIGLIGKNGSGKSTLLNILKGDLTPQKGIINVFIDNNRISQREHYIPLVSQTVDSNLFPSLTVFENFCVIKEKKHPFCFYNSHAKRESCNEILLKANMNLESKIDEQVRFLSGGQKQAISILFALEYEYPILLMDEPTASLDPFVSENIIELSRNEILERKGILILVSHNLNDILKYTENIFILSEGGLRMLPNSKNLQEIDLMKLM